MQLSCAHHVPQLPRRYAPAASVQSPYLTLSGCQLLSQGGVDLECDKHGIGGGSKHCGDNDAQPDA